MKLTQLAARLVRSIVPASGGGDKDEWGRILTRGGRPILGSMFQPRVRDRLAAIAPPWSPEQIVNALKQAENGDLGAQSDLFEHMEDRDGAYIGFLGSRRLAPCGLKWSIEPANDSTEAERVAQLVRDTLNATQNFPHGFRDMQDAIGKSISALWTDWQPGEVSPDSDWRIAGLYHISPKRYRFHWREEKFLILPDEDPLSVSPRLEGASIGIEPPAWKVMIHRTRTKTGHPARAGVARACALYFLLRNYALKDAGIYCDVYGMPVRLGKYGENATEEDKAALASALESLGTDGAAIIHKMTEIDMLETSNPGAGQAPYFNLLKECERNMELAILGQEQTNTANKFGTQGQTQAGGAKVRQDLLEADCIDTQATITQQLIYPIVGFSKLERPFVDENGVTRWPVADRLCPKFKLHYEPEADYESMIAVDVPLHTKLKLPTTLGQIALRYGRELPDGVDPKTLVVFHEEQEEEGDDDDGGSDEKKREPKKKLSSGETRPVIRARVGRRAQEDLDELAEVGLPSTSRALLRMSRPIRAMVEEHNGTLEELQDRLRRAFDDLPEEELAKLVRRNMFVARLHGQASAGRKDR